MHCKCEKKHEEINFQWYINKKLAIIVGVTFQFA